MNTKELPPSLAMFQLIMGFWVSQAIHVAARLGLADYLASGPRTLEDLASASGAHAPSLYRLLRALSSIGVFELRADGSIALTPLAETLQSDVPGSVRWMAMAELGQEHYQAWGNLLHSVKTGEIAFDDHFKQDIWAYYETHADHGYVFNRAMSGMTQAVEGAVVAGYDFTPFATIIDIGGGQGGLLTAMLRAAPSAKGVLFDAPSVVDGARERIEAAGLVDRCRLVGGDFFDEVAAGGDLYTMKWIIHDWDDERSIRILKNIRRAINPGGRVLILDAVIPSGNEPSPGKFFDLNMLVMTGGKERTAEEFEALLSASGFGLTRIIPTPTPVNLIEAEPR